MRSDLFADGLVHHLDFADTDRFNGEGFYVLRVTQSDGEMAWSSPVWVTRA